MTDWQKVIDGGFQRPAGGVTAELITELSEALRSPDLVLRDEQAFSVLARWIPEMDSGQRRCLGDEMAARFTDPEIQARTSPRSSSPGSSKRAISTMRGSAPSGLADGGVAARTGRPNARPVTRADVWACSGGYGCHRFDAHR